MWIFCRYAQYGDVSPKVDVYAFGVVLYELISAKNAVLKTGEYVAESKGLVALVSLHTPNSQIYISKPVTRMHPHLNRTEVSLHLFLYCSLKKHLIGVILQKLFANWWIPGLEKTIQLIQFSRWKHFSVKIIWMFISYTILSQPNLVCWLFELQIAQLGRACTRDNPLLRPSMRSIVVALMTLSSPTEDLDDETASYENQTLINLLSVRWRFFEPITPCL